MEIKELLSELITVANNVLNERGVPENFDLEEFIQVLDDYYNELDDIGQFYYYNNDEDNDMWDEDDFDNKYH